MRWIGLRRCVCVFRVEKVSLDVRIVFAYTGDQMARRSG